MGNGRPMASLPWGGAPVCGRRVQGSSVLRAGSSSARTAAAGAALAEHRARTSTHPGLWVAQDSARHATLCWEQLFLRVVPGPTRSMVSLGRLWCSSAVICKNKKNF